MDEFDVILRARSFSAQLTAEQIGLPLEAYLRVLNVLADDVILRFDTTMADDEAGHTTVIGGKRCIIINGNDRPERQRFTACHEVAHIVLGLATEHGNTGNQFVGRSPNETLCDVFAAELLLPCHLFKPRVEASTLGFDAIESLSAEFIASQTATGSRFAAVCDRPCAFVLTKDGMIQYSSRSTSLREGGGWIRTRTNVPDASLVAQLIKSGDRRGLREIPADEWLVDWRRGGVLLEDSRHYQDWGLGLSLLWFEDECIPSSSEYSEDDDDPEPALRPLDGHLPWPGKNRRRP